MVMTNKRILHCSQYAAPYEGNFIKSLSALEQRLNDVGCEMVYVFPENVQQQKWWTSFSIRHRVYLTAIDLTSSIEEVADIIVDVKPDLIHTHFDGYDIPVVRALKKLNLSVPVVWHFHNALSFLPNFAKAVYQGFCFLRHYYLYGEEVSAIGVNEEVLSFCTRFRGLFGGSFMHSAVISNGINLDRINPCAEYIPHPIFSFLAFGGRNSDKRIDLILSAAKNLIKEYKFKIYITIGTDTKEVVNHFFHGNIPTWCILLEQSDNINAVFAHADCFISSSVHETFSYGICEASVYGLPVIQSDIEGTKWNSNNPSTYVFKSENVDDLAGAMKKVMSEDFYLLSNKTKETQSRNIKEYSLDAWCGKIVNFYEEILSLH